MILECSFPLIVEFMHVHAWLDVNDSSYLRDIDHLIGRGETNRSNIRIKVFVHRCSNFVSLFELFVPLAHAQNNLISKKKPVLAMDESSAGSSSVRKHFEKNKGAGTVTCRLCQNMSKWNGSTTISLGTTSKGNTPLRLQVKLCCQHGVSIYTVAYTHFSFRLRWAKA